MDLRSLRFGLLDIFNTLWTSSHGRDKNLRERRQVGFFVVVF